MQFIIGKFHRTAKRKKKYIAIHAVLHGENMSDAVLLSCQVKKGNQQNQTFANNWQPKDLVKCKLVSQAEWKSGIQA